MQTLKFCLLAACLLLTPLLAKNALADDLQGRIAVTGRLGVTNPANCEFDSQGQRIIASTDAGFIGGGGVLFGVDNNIAMEIDVTHSTYDASQFGTANITTLSVGAQYRLPERQRVVPYVGAGIDTLINDLPSNSVDTVLGMHVAAGVDFFLAHQVALTAELKGVEAFSASVKNYAGAKVGEFDPSNIAFTVGVRIFLN
jgi:outer membrane protein